MRHTTLPECPVCGETERGVKDPDLQRWHCFNCGSSGGFEETYTVTHDATEETP